MNDKAFMREVAKAARWLLENHQRGPFDPSELSTDSPRPGLSSPGIPADLADQIMFILKEKRLLVEAFSHSTQCNPTPCGYLVHVGAPGWFEVLHPRWAWLAPWGKDLRTVLVALVTAAVTACVLKWIGLP